MKKIMQSIFVAGLIFLGLLVGTWADSYNVEAVCTEVKNGIATFTDRQGHYWQWDIEDGESFNEKDVVTLTMHSKSTQMRIDDEILEIK